MAFTSIHKKLIALFRRNLLLSVVLFALAAYILVLFLTRKFSNDLAHNIEAGLISKGKILVTNNSMAMRGMAMDYAFSSIRDLVIATVQGDPDALYGIYMDKDRKPWVMTGKLPGAILAGDTTLLSDSISLWASKTPEPSFRQIGAGDDLVFAFAGPVMDGKERLGTIRYGLSNASIRQAIAEARDRARMLLILTPLGLVLFSVLFMRFALRAVQRQSRSITEPLNALTHAANAITQGDYTAAIQTETDDEVGLLAHDFDSMRRTVKKYTDNLEKMVIERTAQLEAAQKELVEKAHQAGMATIATDVLHNVGNLLNSVLTSGFLIREQVSTSKLQEYFRANALLAAHQADLESFILRDPKGKALLSYYTALEEPLRREHQVLVEQAERLAEKIDTIRDVIIAQQSYASGATFNERMNIAEVIDFALNILSGPMKRHAIVIEKQFEASPVINIQKAKLLQVVTNILKNAKEALDDTPADPKKIIIRTRVTDNRLSIRFEDNGCGIRPEDREKIFTHGFTTKKKGHGFGLHSCANYMKEMNGVITVESPGEGKGAAFILELPLT